MAETYSHSSLAAHGGYHPPFAKVLTLPDSASQPGQHARAMSLGANVLCQGPDGALGNYRIDNERSVPGSLVLIPLFP